MDVWTVVISDCFTYQLLQIHTNNEVIINNNILLDTLHPADQGRQVFLQLGQCTAGCHGSQ